jgi:cyclopropane fatty-acyl-phospholipid synthase-like methyltransferase
MTKFSLSWKSFWEGKTSPLHTHNDENYYRSYGKELSVLYDNFDYQSILEIGCGNGALYPYLGFLHKSYLGVDLSQSMLDTFREKHSDVNINLVLINPGVIFKDDNTYDLIFQNGVIQYFDHKMVQDFFSASSEMLNKGGKIVIGSIPWKLCKKGYHFGEFRPNNSSFLGKVYSYIMASKSVMGRWYSFSDFRDIAKKHSLKVEFFGSLLYPYRFHVVFTKE